MPASAPSDTSSATFALVRLYSSLIAWAFERFYREFAWTYDAVAWAVSQGLWRRWTLASLPFLAGRVLELGCGTGYVQGVLAQARPGAALGLDASPFMLRHTRHRLRQAGRAGLLMQGVAQRLPLADGSVQTVLATFPTSYVLHPHTLAEVRRVLVPTGRMVVVDAAHFPPQRGKRQLYARLIALAYRLVLLASGQQPADSEPEPAERHIYRERLEAAGFQVSVHPQQVGHSRVLVFVALPHSS